MTNPISGSLSRAPALLSRTAAAVRFALAALAISAAPGCHGSAHTEAADSHSPQPHDPHAGASPHSASGDIDAQLAEVARIHGGAGPWAVAGYRMGRHALKQLELAPQSFDLEVIHHTPPQVQFSCIADGAAAATGASVGKLNLRLVEAAEADVATTYRRKSTGAALTLRPTAAFRTRFSNLPREELAAAGRTVMTLADSEIFEEIGTAEVSSGSH